MNGSAARFWVALTCLCVTLVGGLLGSIWWISSRDTELATHTTKLTTLSREMRTVPHALNTLGTDIKLNKTKLDDHAIQLKDIINVQNMMRSEIQRNAEGKLEKSTFYREIGDINQRMLYLERKHGSTHE